MVHAQLNDATFILKLNSGKYKREPPLAIPCPLPAPKGTGRGIGTGIGRGKEQAFLGYQVIEIRQLTGSQPATGSISSFI